MITVLEIVMVAQTLMEGNAAHKRNPSEAAKIGNTKTIIGLLKDPDSHLLNYTIEDCVPLPSVYPPVVPLMPEALDPCGGYKKR